MVEVAGVPERTDYKGAILQELDLAEAERAIRFLVEDKGASVAVHYRKAPRYRGELQQFIQTTIAENGEDMEMLQAQMAFDIKRRSANKGLRP